MPFPAYTNTYALFSKNPSLATWWGTSSGNFVITFHRYQGGDVNSPFSHSLYFRVPAISKYDVKVALKKINLSIGTSIPTPVQVEDYESIPNKGNTNGAFLVGASLYYSVSLEENYGGVVNESAWKINFWNLPYTIYTSYINSTIDQNKYNFDIYAIRQTTTSNIVFTDGSALQASDLNLLAQKQQYIAEEADQHFLFSSIPSADLAVKYDKSGGLIGGNVSINGTLESSGLITAQSGISLSNQKISNLATPTQNNDAVTKEYVDNAVGSGGVFEVLNDSITTAKLDKTANSQAVTTETIRDGAVTNAKVDTIDGSKIINGTLSPVKLAVPINFGNGLSASSIYRNDGATPLGEFSDLQNTRRPVTTNSIRTSAITTAKIATGAVTTDKLNQTAGSQAVTTETIRDGAVTNDKLANGTILSSKLNCGTISYDSSGNLNVPNGISTLNSVVANNISLQRPSNLQFTNNWSSYGVGGHTGFYIKYVPQLLAGGNNPNPNLPPYVQLSPVTSDSPPTIILAEIDNDTAKTNVPTTSKLIRTTWTNRKLNTIYYNNTNYFLLNNNGSFQITSATAPTKWKVSGWSTFGVIHNVGTANETRYTTRIFGFGYAPHWLITDTPNSPNDVTLIRGEYACLNRANGVYQSQKASIDGYLKMSIDTPFSFQYFVTGSDNIYNGTQWAGNAPPFEQVPQGSVTGQIPPIQFHPHSMLILTALEY